MVNATDATSLLRQTPSAELSRPSARRVGPTFVDAGSLTTRAEQIDGVLHAGVDATDGRSVQSRTPGPELARPIARRAAPSFVDATAEGVRAEQAAELRISLEALDARLLHVWNHS